MAGKAFEGAWPVRVRRLATLGVSLLLGSSLLAACGARPAVASRPQHRHRGTQSRGAASPASLEVTSRVLGTYQGSPSPPPQQLAAVSMATPQVGWAVANTASGVGLSVLRTQDGGRSFQPAYTPQEQVVGIATPSAKDVELLENPCLAGQCIGSALVASQDGGKTFETIHTFPGFSATAVSFPDPQDGFVAGAAIAANGVVSTTGTLYVTHDGGKRWSSLPWTSKPFGCGGQVEGLALQFLNPEDGFMLCGGQPGAGMQGKALYRTTDGGEYWTTVGADIYGINGFSHTGPPVDGYVHSLFLLNQSVGYIGLDRGGFYVTRDGGKTWSPAFTAAVPAGSDQAFSIGFLPGGFGWLLGGEGPPLFTTTDQGAHWTQTYPPVIPTGALAVFPGHAYGLMTNQGLPNLVTSSDGGASWSVLPVLPGDVPVSALQVVSENTFLAAQYGSVLLSQDGGMRWSRIDLPTGYSVVGLGYLSLGLGWVTAQNPQRTTSILSCAGTRCTALTTPFTPVASIETAPQAGLAVGTTAAGQSALFSTMDGGRRWTTRLVPQGLHPVGIGVTHDLWWIYSAHHILWSFDKGASWHEIALPESQTITSLSFKNFEDGLMTTRDSAGAVTLWRTSDAGRAFQATGP